jgi:multiple sugar transport system substrate-binding protein
MAIYKDPAIQAKYKYVKPMVESWQQGVPEFRPRFPAWSSITEVVAEFGSKIMLGETTVEQGTKEISTRMESILSKEGYYDGKKKKLQ